VIVRRRGAPWPGLVVTAAIALGGCAAVSDDAQNSSLRALEQPVAKPTPLSVPNTPTRCAQPFKSLPASPLPRAGHMPSGTLMETIHRQGVLRVGVDQNTLRLGYFNPRTRAMEGLDIDLARAVARAIFGRSKGHIVFTAISTDQRGPAIEDGEVDLVASAFSINCARRETMRFSSVYYRAQQKLLVPVDSKIERLDDLQGRPVCATVGSTSIDNLYGTGVVRHPVQLRPDCLVELQEGRVAAITSDDSILVGFKQQDRQTKIVGSCINVERYGMAINRAYPEFVRFVNGVLERIGADGLQRMRNRWLRGLDAPTNAQIARCSRRADRRREKVAAGLQRKQLRALQSFRRWRGTFSAPAIAGLYRCGNDDACRREALR
jgi:polar amino acid transport system substrate-binding protein